MFQYDKEKDLYYVDENGYMKFLELETELMNGDKNE